MLEFLIILFACPPGSTALTSCEPVGYKRAVHRSADDCVQTELKELSEFLETNPPAATTLFVVACRPVDKPSI